MSGCRACGAALAPPFLELGATPLANAFLTEAQLALPEPRYPLDVCFCERCGLVQLADVALADPIFGPEYAYFSSYSDTWLAHCEAYSDMIIERLGLGRESSVVEIASNDGYLLQYFAARAIPVLGVEPSRNTAETAIARGVPTDVAFFGRGLGERLARDRGPADLVIGNNVLAHVPDPNDFVAGLRALCARRGTITLELPHFMQLVNHTQFDTIYHEHYAYFSALTAQRLAARHGLELYDVDELPTHGGSLRLYLAHRGVHPVRARVAELIAREHAAGLHERATFDAFAGRVAELQRAFVAFLEDAAARGRRVVGYGAPAKGNTLLNTCGVGPALLPFTVDRSPHKQGRFLPGSHIPIRHPDAIFATRPDLVLILPWNLRAEIASQLAAIRAWGGRFVTAVPSVEVHP